MQLKRLIIGVILVSLLGSPAFAGSTCKVKREGHPQALTGQVYRAHPENQVYQPHREKKRSPRFVAHSKGAQWGQIVYDRER